MYQEDNVVSPDRVISQKYERLQSQPYQEMEAVRPVDCDKLMEAADLRKTSIYWAVCEQGTKRYKACQQLIAKIVDRIFVYDDTVIALRCRRRQMCPREDAV